MNEVYSISELSACYAELCKTVKQQQDCIDALKARTLNIDFIKCCVGISGATVDVNGEIANRCGDTEFDITRTAEGFYNFTPPAGAIFAHVEAIESPNSRDSIEMHMGTSFTGGTAHISEGDNGQNPNTPRDRPFSVIWYGDKNIIANVTLSDLPEGL